MPHWLVIKHAEAKAAIVAEPRRRYPDAPTEPPRGSRGADSTYLHYIVCHLEYQSLIKLLGPREARGVIDFRCRQCHTDIHQAAIGDFAELDELFERRGPSLHAPGQAR